MQFNNCDTLKLTSLGPKLLALTIYIFLAALIAKLMIPINLLQLHPYKAYSLTLSSSRRTPSSFSPITSSYLPTPSSNIHITSQHFQAHHYLLIAYLQLIFPFHQLLLAYHQLLLPGLPPGMPAPGWQGAAGAGRAAPQQSGGAGTRSVKSHQRTILKYLEVVPWRQTCLGGALVWAGVWGGGVNRAPRLIVIGQNGAQV